MENWEKVEVREGFAEFESGNLKVTIENAQNPGCFCLELYKDGHLFKTAFWHGGDMEIPENCYEDGKLDWEKYFGDPEFPQCLNYVEWQRREVYKMSEDDLEALIVGKNYSEELCDEFDWEDCYPVVSKGKIIAIFNGAWPKESGYANKPIVDDIYIDADAEDVEED